jgi:hypothetical protein
MGHEILTVVVMNVAIFWDIAPCSPYLNQRFEGTYQLHLEGKKSLPARCFIARLISDPEDGGDTFLRNISSNTENTELYPRRWQHSSRLCLLSVSFWLHSRLTLKMNETFFPETSVDFQRLLGVISKEIELIVTIGVGN